MVQGISGIGGPNWGPAQPIGPGSEDVKRCQSLLNYASSVSAGVHELCKIHNLTPFPPTVQAGILQEVDHISNIADSLANNYPASDLGKLQENVKDLKTSVQEIFTGDPKKIDQCLPQMDQQINFMNNGISSFCNTGVYTP